jgi:hypothetical protein
MADRLPPPLPTDRTRPPEQSAQAVPPVPAKPGKLELVQKTVADVATCVKGITQMVEFVEKHLGSGSTPKPPGLPAAMPTGMPALPSFPMNMPALPTESVGFSVGDAGFGGLAWPDWNAMSNGFAGFTMPDWGMGAGFDPNFFAGFNADPNQFNGIDFNQM